MFGPEFESSEFTSNRGMTTVIRSFLGGTDDEVARQRPDLVMLPDSSIGAYSADDFDDENEIVGIRSVVIVELKKGGFELKKDEIRQAEDYVSEVRKANLVQDVTKITAYVLGARLDGAERRTIGERQNVHVIPMAYETVLRKAHARTFHLKAKLEQSGPRHPADEEVAQALQEPAQSEMELQEASK